MTTAETLALPVVSLTREQVGTVDVPAPLVAGPVRSHLLYEAVKSQRASWRAGTHATKTRGQVSGGGKKPWKQKGTGRARAGSIRSPLWPGGAVVFGPQPRSYEYRLPRGARRAALRAALASRHGEGRLTVVDAFVLPEPKTKRVLEALRGLGLEGSVLIVLPEVDPLVLRAARNLPDVKVVAEGGLTPFDVLGHRHLLVTQPALERLAVRLGGAA
ncbi:MAG TPA: 50S ribosomal protein L4 [Candidatus Limnocylindria bacterium]|nr:50S ribosomal protein L4 [Candidatus Limnocylindria bacterium]